MRRHLLLLLLVLGGSACSDPAAMRECQAQATLDRELAQVQAILDRELAVGSSEEQIKKAFDAVGAAYSYDDFDNCYRGTIPASRRHDGEWKSVISLRVCMDGDRKFTTSEVETALTHL